MGSISEESVSILGTVVNRAKADIFDGTTTTLFNVIGGKCAITGLVAEVKDGALGAIANNVKFVANPTTGTSVDMCAVLDTTGDEEGTVYSITGTLASALVGTTAGAVAYMSNPIIVNTGSIDLSSSGDNGTTNSATVQVTLFYSPIDSGASISAA